MKTYESFFVGAVLDLTKNILKEIMFDFFEDWKMLAAATRSPLIATQFFILLKFKKLYWEAVDLADKMIDLEGLVTKIFILVRFSCFFFFKLYEDELVNI